MTDPLDALHTGATPVDPDPDFRARLMAEVRASLTAPDSMSGTDRDAPTTPLEITVNDRPAPRSNVRRIALLSTAAAVIIGLVLVVTLRDDPDPEPPAAPVTTTAPSTTAAPTTEAPTTEAPTTEAPAVTDPLDDNAIAGRALLGSDDVGGGYLAQLGETFLNYTTLGVDLPECAAWKDTVFTPLKNATRRTQVFYKQFGAQFEQAVWVFPTVEQATTAMDGISAPDYAPCDVAVGVAAVDAASCCEQSVLAPSEPRAIAPAGDQQVARGASGTFVTGGQQTTAVNTIVYTRVGRVVIVFSVPDGLDAPSGPGGPDATIEEMVAAAITGLDGLPID